jgi:hypothetical protein
MDDAGGLIIPECRQLGEGTISSALRGLDIGHSPVGVQVVHDAVRIRARGVLADRGHGASRRIEPHPEPTLPATSRLLAVESINYLFGINEAGGGFSWGAS